MTDRGRMDPWRFQGISGLFLIDGK